MFRNQRFYYAFTQDASGVNLPSADGLWQHYKDMELLDTDKRIVMDSKQAIEAIEMDGYFIVPVGIDDVSR